MAYSTSWRPISPIVGLQPIAEVSTTQNQELGLIVQAKDVGSNRNGVGEFIYVKGVTNGATGSVVGINADDGSTTLAVANGKYVLVGVLMSDLDASTDYGWAQITGKAVGKVLAAFADNGDCYLTATAGSVDDADVAGDFVVGMKGASAIDFPATGMAELELSRARTTDGADD